MSEIFATTMDPTKKELIGAWLPRQPWFAGEREPVLETIGGFRLDDPAGEVGLEFIIVADSASSTPVTYHVPLAYRGAPLPGAEAFLLGTSEHGVLGKRWIYDAEGDPVWQAQVWALLAGDVQAQHQNISHTLEPLVGVHRAGQESEAGVGIKDQEIAVIRRPVAGTTGSSGASAWIGSPWSDAGQGVSGAVIEFS
ncbi:maltokinase N-terminal cap-like domain-containing protein [Paeniglutamicibacter sp.]|uniref:maltokinase N-terminal cap-like domain-containing protein n=1 Tax=Paeniglutamicibacter sp. TaxID=1934391 RepID=UPI00398996C3